MHQQQLLSPILEAEVFPLSSKYIAPSFSQSVQTPLPWEGLRSVLGPRERLEPVLGPIEGSGPVMGSREGLEQVPVVREEPGPVKGPSPSSNGTHASATTDSVPSHEGEGEVLSSIINFNVITTKKSSLEEVVEEEKKDVVEEGLIAADVIDDQHKSETVFGKPLYDDDDESQPHNAVDSHSLLIHSREHDQAEAILRGQGSEPFHPPPPLFLPFHLAGGVIINVDITIEAGHHKGLSSCEFVQQCLVDRYINMYMHMYNYMNSCIFVHVLI
jgi:hypothetical protein